MLDLDPQVLEAVSATPIRTRTVSSPRVMANTEFLIALTSVRVKVKVPIGKEGTLLYIFSRIGESTRAKYKRLILPLPVENRLKTPAI